MARHPFGGGIADYVVSALTGGTIFPGQTLLVFAPNTVVHFYNAPIGGSQYTDLATDAAGLQPISTGTVTSDANGAISTTFYGPDGVGVMWADASTGGTGPRVLMQARDIADAAYAAQTDAANAVTAATSAGNAAAAATDTASAAASVAAGAGQFVWYDPTAQAFPPRPVGIDNPVIWVGPVQPPIGGGYAQNGDLRIPTIT